MCLGAGARAQNEAARRQYEYQNQKRKRNWLQQISIYGAKKVQGALNISRGQQALTDKYGLTELAKRRARGQAERKYESLRTEAMQNSNFAKMVAGGRTGKSIGRIGVMEIGAYGRKVSEIGAKLRTNDFVLDQENKAARNKLKGFIEQQEAQTAFTPLQDVAPPQPVMQNVGAAMFMDALSIGSSIAGLGTSFGGNNFWKNMFQ